MSTYAQTHNAKLAANILQMALRQVGSDCSIVGSSTPVTAILTDDNKLQSLLPMAVGSVVTHRGTVYIISAQVQELAGYLHSVVARTHTTDIIRTVVTGRDTFGHTQEEEQTVYVAVPLARLTTHTLDGTTPAMFLQQHMQSYLVPGSYDIRVGDQLRIGHSTLAVSSTDSPADNLLIVHCQSVAT